jgi:hypothetical protein
MPRVGIGQIPKTSNEEFGNVGHFLFEEMVVWFKRNE